MADKQIQKAGNNAQQLQATNMIVNTGIDEKRVREIYHEMNMLAIKNCTEEAINTSYARVAELENRLIPKMETIEGAFEAFADPSFQSLLVKAQIRAACSERPADYDLLSELLIHRFQRGDNRIIRAGISRAVEIVDEISDDALLGLTVFHLISLRPSSGNIYEGLNVLNDIFGKIIYGELPTGTDWLDHLDILDAIRINSFGKMQKIKEYYPDRLSRYVEVGIRKTSDNYNKALELLDSVGLSRQILIEHLLNSDYVKLDLPTNEKMDSFTWRQEIFQNGLLLPIIIPLSELQKNAIKSICDLYEKDDNVKQQNIKRFMEVWDKMPNLKVLQEWWDNINTSFQITSVGRVLAHSNAQRCDKSLPSLY